MNIMDIVRPPKHRVEDIVWNEILMREAVRGLTENRPRYAGDVGKSIAFFQHYLRREHVVANDGLPLLRPGVADKAYTPIQRQYSTGLVNVDPGLLDGFDLFKLLMHFDSDQAKDLNYVGFSRGASPAAHTIFALFSKGFRVDVNTMKTLARIIDKHLKQASLHLSEQIDLPAPHVLSILSERRDIWNTPRILAGITSEPTRIENHTFVFVMGNSIQVHMGRTAPRIGKMLAEYQREILADPELGPLARSLYAQHGRNGSGGKMFNGELIDFDTVLFPLHPIVAVEMIEHLEAYDRKALIDHSVRMLALHAPDNRARPTPSPKEI